VRRFRFTVEVDVDTDRLMALRGERSMSEFGIKRVLLRAIATMSFYSNLFKVVSSDCIEQKVRK